MQNLNALIMEILNQLKSTFFYEQCNRQRNVQILIWQNISDILSMSRLDNVSSQLNVIGSTKKFAISPKSIYSQAAKKLNDKYTLIRWALSDLKGRTDVQQVPDRSIEYERTWAHTHSMSIIKQLLFHQCLLVDEINTHSDNIKIKIRKVLISYTKIYIT